MLGSTIEVKMLSLFGTMLDGQAQNDAVPGLEAFARPGRWNCEKLVIVGDGICLFDSAVLRRGGDLETSNCRRHTPKRTTLRGGLSLMS